MSKHVMEQQESSHVLGGQITLQHEIYGDILMDCVHILENGNGVYLMHYALPRMEFDAAEAAGRGLDFGNNDYSLSNIRQWLNSEDGRGWWKSTHVFDAPPSYADRPGFLYGFTEGSLALVGWGGPEGFESDTFFLLSEEEVEGGLPYLKTPEGRKLLRKTDKDGNPVWWWLRSPSPSDPGIARDVGTDGHTYSYDCAFDRCGAVAAACVI